ncbi:MAG TPA: hypothetical protein VKT33_09750 [Candidatus Angelobacter sp.]|nr:hypothetical protein [Candidatus Angelobacter sp.]
MTTELRPMSTGEVLDRAFHLYRSYFPLFAGMGASYAACVVIGTLIVVWIPLGPVIGILGVLLLAVVELVFVLLALIGLALAGGATIYAVSQIYLGREATIRDSYTAVRPLIFRLARVQLSKCFRFLGRLIRAQFLFGIVFGPLYIGFNAESNKTALIVLQILALPVLVASTVWEARTVCGYALAVPACLLERLSAPEALKRSQSLSSQFLGRIFLVLLLTAAMGAGLLALLLAITWGKLSPTLGVVWSTSSIFAALTLTSPIGMITISLLYYDLRVRKEAFNLQLLMASIGQPWQEQVAPVPAIG